jgi:hypothetical protein
MQSGKIFVCYRREDSAGHAGRLYDRLSQRFPRRVFMDVTSIGVGTRWAKVIEDTLGSCQVAIILIGKEWLAGKNGARRFDRADDPIRAEITAALRQNLTIVPLLVSGAAMPARADLPPELAAITEWQALRVDDDDFDHDASRLLRALEHQLGEDETTEVESSGEEQEIRRLSASKGPGRQQITQSRNHSPDAPGRSGFFGITLGSVRFWISVGVTAVTLVAVQRGVSPRAPASVGGPSAPAEVSSLPPPVSTAGSAATSTATPTRPSPGIERSSASPDAPISPAHSLAGRYDIIGYRENGIALPIVGTMSLSELEPGRYQFETFVTNTAVNVSFRYRGTLQGSANAYALTTAQTDDPRALVMIPIPTRVSFDGSTLTTQNDYGQAAVWKKQ